MFIPEAQRHRGRFLRLKAVETAASLRVSASLLLSE
jgi:hypothetical protein